MEKQLLLQKGWKASFNKICGFKDNALRQIPKSALLLVFLIYKKKLTFIFFIKKNIK